MNRADTLVAASAKRNHGRFPGGACTELNIGPGDHSGCRPLVPGCESYSVFCRANGPVPLPAATPKPDSTPLTAHGPRSGFSLIEMIVATTVLSLAIVGLLGLIQTSLGNAGRVRQYDRAAMRARSTMSELLVTDPLPVPGRLEGRYDQSSGWEAVISPFEFSRTPRIGTVMVVQIRLTVWWNADGRRKTAVFDSLRRLLITRDHQEALP